MLCSLEWAGMQRWGGGCELPETCRDIYDNKSQLLHQVGTSRHFGIDSLRKWLVVHFYLKLPPFTLGSSEALHFYLYSALVHVVRDLGVNKGEFSWQAELQQCFVSCSKSGIVARFDQFLWNYGTIQASPYPNKTGNVLVTEHGAPSLLCILKSCSYGRNV